MCQRKNIELIEKNLNGIANKPSFGEYEESVVMMMYDSVVIRKQGELAVAMVIDGNEEDRRIN